MCDTAKKIQNVKCETVGLLSYVELVFTTRKATICFFVEKIVVAKRILIFAVHAGHDILSYKIIDYRPLKFCNLGPHMPQMFSRLSHKGVQNFCSLGHKAAQNFCSLVYQEMQNFCSLVYEEVQNFCSLGSRGAEFLQPWS